ncbi:hypothetical protein AVEN_220982-1 [Araneus ventricosus]|uniref:Uncharacterized protein n=1 Tax=Araneus ventricosus TaxID=182803 RepID=A0A4Y2EM87_ARAVE|nr:hypothetical protein AVEN_220982-1 [Araneus ventricosus]
MDSNAFSMVVKSDKLSDEFLEEPSPLIFGAMPQVDWLSQNPSAYLQSSERQDLKTVYDVRPSNVEGVTADLPSMNSELVWKFFGRSSCSLILLSRLPIFF